MKKNRFIKIAAVVFTLCLITTCGISSTLAKYTTGGNAQDSARVAKWGVELTMEGDPIFRSVYNNVEADNYATLGVAADKVVAPGTSSEEVASSARFAISGKPEVAVEIKIDFNFVNDIYLKAATGLRDHTKAAVENNGIPSYETFDLADDYYPVVFTLKQVRGLSGSTQVDMDVTLATGNLDDIKTFLDSIAIKQYAPNTDLYSVYELSWAWAYEVNDEADTYLGQLAAGFNPDSKVAGTDYNLNVDYSLEITVTQID